MGKHRVAAFAATCALAGASLVVLVAGPAAATTISVATETQYRNALTTLSADASGPHTMDITADIILVGATDPAYTGTPPLTLAGNGHTLTVAGAASRVLFQNTTSALTVQDLTLTGGHDAGAFGGGAIRAGGAVTLVNSTVTGNTTASSGGGGISADGSVTLTNSTVSHNTGGSNAGGVFAFGSVTVTSSTVSHNTAASGNGGGILAEGSVTVTSSTVSSNTGTSGGGVESDGGNVTVTNSTVSGNTGNGVGGGIATDGNAPNGNVTLTNSTVSGNVASGGVATNGGGIFTAHGSVTLTSSTMNGNTSATGGGGFWAEGAVVVTNSTISGNSDSGTFGGGGFRANSSRASATITGTTISGNNAGLTGGIGGGGIASSGPTSITNSTIVGNTAGTFGGGGIAVGRSSVVTLVYATVVGNTAPATCVLGTCGTNISGSAGTGSLASFGSVVALPHGGGTNCAQLAGTSPNGFNFSDDASCGFTASTDKQSGGDPGLGPLASNGGPTQTLLPQTGSALIDKIPAASPCGGVNIVVDQRGLSRPVTAGTFCDIGAVEVQVTPVVVAPRFTG